MSVDALQYQALDSSIVGILIRSPFVAGFERDGNVNVWVRPDRQREGIATSLLEEALRRWSSIDLIKQDDTAVGRAVAARLAEWAHPRTRFGCHYARPLCHGSRWHRIRPSARKRPASTHGRSSMRRDRTHALPARNVADRRLP